MTSIYFNKWNRENLKALEGTGSEYQLILREKLQIEYDANNSLEKKEIFICKFGSSIMRKSLSKHLNSKKHKNTC